MKLPVTYKHRVWHVGFLDRPRFYKSSGWYEGSGLPVSELPEDWRHIAKLGDAPVWECHPATPRCGIFVDYVGLSKRNRALLTRAALKADWLVPAVLYQVWHYEDDWVYMVFDDREEAERETAAGREYDDSYKVKPVRSYVASPKLRTFWKQLTRGSGPDPMTATEHAHLLVLEATGKYDGVWWYETYDPSIYSAPRGTLFQSKYPEWTCREAEEYPQEDEQPQEEETGVE